jgi:Asp-tRNA(Asn)/Glu-tRNA(Gln) amidotransferase A subunit family amidase
VPRQDPYVGAGVFRAGPEPAYRGTPEGATPPNVNGGNGVPGGSSSGAAASVAFGLAAAGIGSDTGGSVRIPSAFNDLVGLKTTHGRLSNEGVVPLVDSLDTVGPLCRSVEDCAALLAVMDGGAMADLTGASLEGARLLVLQNYSDDVREAPGAAFVSACERLSAAGAVIEQKRFRNRRRRSGWQRPLCPGKPMASGVTRSRRRPTRCSTGCASGSAPAALSARPISWRRPGG